MPVTVARIVVDTTGDMHPLPRTYIVTIPDGLDVTADDVEAVLKGLRLGPYDTEGGIIDVAVESLPTLEDFITARFHELIRKSGSDLERLRLAEALQVRRAALGRLGLLNKE